MVYQKSKNSKSLSDIEDVKNDVEFNKNDFDCLRKFYTFILTLLYIATKIMDPITTNNQQHLIKRAPNANNPIPLRWLNVVQLHLSGMDDDEVAAKTGYTANSVYRILHHKDVQYVRQQLMEHTQQRFESRFNKVIDVIDSGLEDADPKVQAIFTNQWLKSHGKFFEKKTVPITVNATAEDIVFNMLQGNLNVDQSGS